jgi:hypothetical protein
VVKEYLWTGDDSDARADLYKALNVRREEKNVAGFRFVTHLGRALLWQSVPTTATKACVPLTAMYPRERWSWAEKGGASAAMAEHFI